MKQIKIKHKRDFFTGLVQLIDELVKYAYVEDAEKLLVATLAEFKERIEKRLITVKKEYSITLTHTQAIALRLLYTGFVGEYKSYLGSKLHTISNQVKKLYQ